jgi:signal peptidase I
MEPAIRSQEEILVDHSAYRDQGPVRGDIITFFRPLPDSTESVLLAKRVVGVPGEEFQLIDKDLSARRTTAFRQTIATLKIGMDVRRTTV